MSFLYFPFFAGGTGFADGDLCRGYAGVPPAVHRDPEGARRDAAREVREKRVRDT